MREHELLHRSVFTQISPHKSRVGKPSRNPFRANQTGSGMFHQIVKELVLPGLQEGLRTNGDYSLTTIACQQRTSRAFLFSFRQNARLAEALYLRRPSAAIGRVHRRPSTSPRYDPTSARALQFRQARFRQRCILIQRLETSAPTYLYQQRTHSDSNQDNLRPYPFQPARTHKLIQIPVDLYGKWDSMTDKHLSAICKPM
jgi:hypothetical protein